MAPREKTAGWLSRITKRSGNPSSGAVGPDETAKATHERRREQIRRAQRTHRERKEYYIKNLETEVVKLREKDAAHEQIVTAYKRKISDLNQILLANGIAIPPELLHIESLQAAIAVQVQPDGERNIHVTMPTVHTMTAQTSTQSPSVAGTSNLPSAGTTTTSEMSDLANSYDQMRFGQSQSTDPRLINDSSSRGHTNDLDAAQVALDFVLDLERPCLTHHGPNVHDGEFSGHRLMVQTPIMAHATTPAPIYNTAPGGQVPMNISWNVPAVEVERLLNLSTRLSLEGEITPIEAWQRVKQHPGFASLDRQRLDEFKVVLQPEVQCYGFGAVIDEQYFDFLLQHHLGPGPQ